MPAPTPKFRRRKAARPGQMVEAPLAVFAGQALAALTDVIAAAQARGEVRPGDPRTYALQLVAPLVVGLIWRETFVPAGGQPFDMAALARQHVATLAGGLLAGEAA